MAAAVSGVTDTATSTTSSVKKTAADEQQDRFLKLLVTQMKNQDPLNPLDNAQVTSQMAQLSTVNGIEKLNTTLAAFTKAQAFQSVGMIGHYVLAPGDSLNLSGGKALAGVELQSAADSVKVNIVDSKGVTVRTIDLAKQDAGVVSFQWDGKTTEGLDAPDGAYKFNVTATQGGKSIAPTALSVGMVQSVLMDQVGPSLSVQGLGLVDLANVKQIL
jgi:flagellar basal-body rod modification protein FlgD